MLVDLVLCCGWVKGLRYVLPSLDPFKTDRIEPNRIESNLFTRLAILSTSQYRLFSWSNSQLTSDLIYIDYSMVGVAAADA